MFFLLALLKLHANPIETSQELENYVAAFPYAKYAVFHVVDQGSFYVELDRNESIKNILRTGQQWEPYILDYIRKYTKPGTVAVDIGAHIGTFTISMSQMVGIKGTVYTFEPQKKFTVNREKTSS